MSFSFKPKHEAINWHQVRNTDLQAIIQNNDVAALEASLGNLTNATLSKEDIRKFGDKNLIKLFKLGQLNMEYLMFEQQHSEQLLAEALEAYNRDLE